MFLSAVIRKLRVHTTRSNHRISHGVLLDLYPAYYLPVHHYMTNDCHRD